MENEIVLFSLTSSPKLTEEVARLLEIKVGETEVHHFADGEVLARSPDNVRGKVVYIIQSTCSPVAERIMELLIFIDGLRTAKAKEVNLVVPYYGFSRQDRVARPGEPITAKLIADLLGTVGVNRVITMDLHTPQTQGFFSCPVDDLSPIALFGEHFRESFKRAGIATSDVVVVSPDHGSIHRARDMASELPDSVLAIIDKRRPAPNVAEVINIVGDVKGKHCLIVDDIIDTCGTVKACTEAILARGALSVRLAGTHAVLSKNAREILKTCGLEEIVFTNSIEHEDPFWNIVSIAPMIAGVIRATEDGHTIPDSWMSFY